jgi:threonylcarbamoyladenosine tRNA methylthiotransferase MtaB
MVALPLLHQRQSDHQRAFLKVQDGCDAHCTYCVIPQLRPSLWSKPIDDAVEEARRLVDAGHGEIVLTGIFLGAYGQATALRRRQGGGGGGAPLAELLDALCTRVAGLRRLRLSSMEPLDVTGELIALMRSHRQIVPHFHLPLQSGSDELLRRMNRQYGRQDYLEMIAHLKSAFDRPAITTDVIVGFPGETAEHFGRTVEVVGRVGFIHVHAFSYSPRPGTAAARWTRDYVHGPVVNRRIERLLELSERQSLEFRRQFAGEEVEVLVEGHHVEGLHPVGPHPGPLPQGEGGRAGRHASPLPTGEGAQASMHGRCERYFDVHFQSEPLPPGTPARVRVDRVTATHTSGTLVGAGR